MNEDQRTYRNQQISRSMKLSAEARTCRKCGRGNALVRDEPPKTPGWVGVHCRYCDYARGQWL